MKIAYLILAHIEPEHIARLALKLTKGSKNEVFVHIDKKADESVFRNAIGKSDSIHFVEDRQSVSWAGFAMVRATINSMRQAMRQGEFDRYVMLQGVDYPILSNAKIDSFFDKHRDTEFILASNHTHSGDYKELHKYRNYWFLDNPNAHQKLINIANKVLLKLHLYLPLKKPYIYIGSRKYEIYGGNAHLSFTRPAVKYILEFYDNNPDFNKYFSTAYASDESYFHTIIYNSEFLEKTQEKRAVPYEDSSIARLLNLTYYEYPDVVVVFKKKDDYPKLLGSGCLYFRKATNESGELLDYIDEHL